MAQILRHGAEEHKLRIRSVGLAPVADPLEGGAKPTASECAIHIKDEVEPDAATLMMLDEA